MPTLVVKSNVAQGTDVLVPDMGVIVPSSGGAVTFVEDDEIEQASESRDLRDLATDNAHGGGSSTLILNDGTFDIAQGNVVTFLSTASLAGTGPYGILRRAADARVPQFEVDVDPVTDDQVATKRYVDSGASGITATQHQTLLQLIHFIQEGPAEGFTSGATKTVTGTNFPSQILWKRADATNLVKRTLTWTGINLTTDKWEMYAADGSTILATVTDTVSYSGIFEAGRTRAIA